MLDCRLIFGLVIISGQAICGEMMFGRCNETLFLTEVFYCEQRFFAALARNGLKQNCWKFYNQHISRCYNYTLWTCFRDTSRNWRDVIDTSLFRLQQYGNARLFCDKKDDFVTQAHGESYKDLKPCEDGFDRVGRNCTAAFRDKKHIDSSLCSLFERATNCTARASKRFCKTLVQYPKGLKHKNPFCNRPTKTVSSTSVSLGSSNDQTSDPYDGENSIGVVFVKPTAKNCSTAHGLSLLVILLTWAVTFVQYL